MVNTITFGYHLTLDLYGCPKDLLNDMKVCYSALEEIPGKLGMSILTRPYLVRADANDIKDPGGYTGFVTIQESHVSLHTFAKRGFVSIDVYSCKEFDRGLAIKHFQELFEPQDIEENYVIRGTRYPEEDIYE